MEISYQLSNKYSSKITLIMSTGVNNRLKKVLVGANEVDKKVLKGVNRDESVL